jgi:hypothetical protein
MKTCLATMPRTVPEFVQWLHVQDLSADEIGLAEAILSTPRSEMADFELALASAKTEDIGLLHLLVGSALLKGDWRRAKVHGRIEQLEDSANG